MMETTLIAFLDCPAYLDTQGADRCGLPAEVQHRYLTTSTDGPLESARIQCPRGHWFNGPVESLSWNARRAAPASGRRPAATHGGGSWPARKTRGS
jgi:hypothetical protein